MDNATQNTRGGTAVGTNVLGMLVDAATEIWPAGVSRDLIRPYAQTFIFGLTHDSYLGCPVEFVAPSEGRIKIDQNVLNRLPRGGGTR